MASATRASTLVQLEPQIALAGIELVPGRLQDFQDPNATAVQIGLRLSNPGHVRIDYRILSFTAVLDDTSYNGENLDTRGGTVHPKMENTFKSAVVRLNRSIRAPTSGEIAFKIEYWSIETERHSFKGKLALMFVSSEPLVANYHFAEGPEYA